MTVRSDAADHNILIIRTTLAREAIELAEDEVLELAKGWQRMMPLVEHVRNAQAGPVKTKAEQA